MVDKIASSSEELEICIFEVVVVVVLTVVALTIAACMQWRMTNGHLLFLLSLTDRKCCHNDFILCKMKIFDKFVD